ncbi:class I SAM-dependent methyltransferase [Saccharopolyspora sp. ASAGF58]|nr:class I SAM-dependent methyltransferase [Saccharopolyspora sp. ASAGF58]
MRGDYTPTAEFYELVADRQVRSSGPPLRAVLSDVDGSAGEVLEIGAGTGRVTEVIAEALPTARIVAAEPSPAMRAILTSRVATDDDLRARVRVTAQAAPDLDLPESLAAVVIFGVVGHLDADERRRLWRRLGERLVPGGVVVVELMGVRSPRDIPPTLSLTAVMGRQNYEWWVAGRPAGPDLMRFINTWKVRRGDVLVREITDSYEWYTVDTELLAAESGMTIRPVPRVVTDAAPVELAVLVK